MGFLPLGLRVVMDRFYQSCSGIPGENIFFTRVFLIFRSILTTLVLLRPHIYYELGRPVGTSVRPVPAGTIFNLIFKKLKYKYLL